MRLPSHFRTTAVRLTGLFSVLLLLCIAILFAAIRWYAIGTLQAELSASVAARIEAILADEDPALSANLIGGVKEAIAESAGTYGLLLDPGGRRLAGNLPPVRPEMAGWLTLRQPVPEKNGGEPHPIWARAERLQDGGTLLIGQDAFAVQELDELIMRAFLLGGALTLALALTGGVLVSRGVLRRIAAIGQAGQSIMRGDLARRLPTRGTDDELDQLVAGFNALLDRISALMEAMQQVTNDVAHDLRTPLSRLRNRLSEARRRSRTVPEYEAILDRSIADTDAILDTFAALLRIAQIECLADDTGLVSIDASTIVDTVVELYLPMAEDRGQRLRGMAENVVLRGDRELLIQMMGNLVVNACGHTRPGTQIEVGVQRRGDTVLLWVGDDGTGIPKGEREHVFRRFYRLEASRTSPGSGLGLSLVQAIAMRHGGRVSLVDCEPGLRVEVILPTDK